MAKERDYELEFYKSEAKRLQIELDNERNIEKMPSNTMKDINDVIEIASEMRNLLNECRYQQLNITLVKRIDYVLRRARDLD